MQEKRDERTIDNHTNIRFPISVLFGLVVAVTIFLYSQDIILHNRMDERYKDVKNILEGKANVSEAADRYTGKDAETDSKYSEASISALRRELTIKIEALDTRLTEAKTEHDMDIKHVHDDIHSHGHKHSEIEHSVKH